MSQAKDQLVEEHRREWLVNQIESRRLANDARTFVEAAKRATNLSEDDQLWLKWILEYADSVDRTQGPLAPPPAPEPSPERLRPYLGHWSPYGPDR